MTLDDIVKKLDGTIKELVERVLRSEHLSKDYKEELLNHLVSLTGTEDYRFTDNLVGLARHGVITAALANEIVQELGLSPIEKIVSPNHHTEHYWTIDMCVAWIAWRDDSKVCAAWPEFMQSVSRWRVLEPSGSETDPTILGFELYTPKPDTILIMKTVEALDQDVDGQKLLSVHESYNSLLNAFKNGSLQAIGLNDCGEACEISQIVFGYLQEEYDAAERLLFRHRGNGEAYTDIKIARDSVTKKWKRLKGPTATQYSHAEKQQIRKQMYEKLKLDPEATRDKILDHVKKSLPFAKGLTRDKKVFISLLQKARRDAGSGEKGKSGRRKA